MITIAICTWNRAALLQRALGSLTEMQPPASLPWECVVIDNNSTDSTAQVVHVAAERLPVRYVFEARQGISHARNRALNEARGEMTLFIDDDCRVSPDILSRYAEAFAQFPDAAIYAGSVEPEFEVPAPRWMAENLDVLAPVFAIVMREPASRVLSAHEGIVTANLAVRTDIGRRFLFETSLGAVGDSRVRGEDIEFVDRIRRAGHQTVWVGAAKVSHFIPASRMDRQYLWEMFVGEGRLAVRLNGTHSVGSRLFGYPRWVVRRFVQAHGARILWSWTGGPRWVKAFRDSAEAQGMLLEWSDSRAA